MVRFFRFFDASVLPFLVLLVIQLFLGSILNLFLPGMSQETRYLFLVMGVLLCGILFFFWYRYETRGVIRGETKKLMSIRTIALFLFLGVGCQFFFSGAMNLIRPVFSKTFQDYNNAIEGILGGNLIVVLIYTAFIAPVTEELIFRGVILHRSNRLIPFIGTNILQAAIFGLYHQNMVQGMYAMLIGLLLGLIYYKYRTIIAPILLHIMINTSAFLVLLLPSNITSYILMCVGGASIATLAVIGLKLWKQEEIEKDRI